jgi:predicted PurR-regulated permease PerM
VAVGAWVLLGGLRQVIETVLPALGSFFLAGLLLAIFGPITRWLKARRVNDVLAALSGVLVALLVFALIGLLFAVPVATGAAAFARELPSAVARGAATLDAAIAGFQGLPADAKQALQPTVASAAARSTSAAVRTASLLVSGSSALLGFGLSMFLAFILMFWFLKDGPRIVASMLEVVPRRFRTDVAVMGSSFDRSFSGYLLATAINTSLIFIGDGVGFAIIKLPNGWFIAAMGAVLGIIPYLGSILSFAIAVLIGLMAGPKIGILTGLIVFVTDQIVYSFIGPVVASKTVVLHPVMVIFALSIGAAVAGIAGAVLSIPIAAAIRVVYIYYRDRDAQPTPAPTVQEPLAEEA